MISTMKVAKVLLAVVFLGLSAVSWAASAKEVAKLVVEGQYVYYGEHPSVAHGNAARKSVKHSGQIDSWKHDGRLFVAVAMRSLGSQQKSVFGNSARRFSAPLARKLKVVDSREFGWVVVYANCNVMQNALAGLCGDTFSECQFTIWSAQLWYMGLLHFQDDAPLSFCGVYANVPVSSPDTIGVEEFACRYAWGGTNGIESMDPTNEMAAIPSILNLLDPGYADLRAACGPM